MDASIISISYPSTVGRIELQSPGGFFLVCFRFFSLSFRIPDFPTFSPVQISCWIYDVRFCCRHGNHYTIPDRHLVKGGVERMADKAIQIPYLIIRKRQTPNRNYTYSKEDGSNSTINAFPLVLSYLVLLRKSRSHITSIHRIEVLHLDPVR